MSTTAEHPVLSAIEAERVRVTVRKGEVCAEIEGLQAELERLDREFDALEKAGTAISGAISDDSSQETAGPGDPPTPGPAETEPDEEPEEAPVEEAPVEADEPPSEPAPKRVFGENGNGPASGGQRAMEQSARKDKVLDELRKVAREEPAEISAGELGKRCGLDTAQANNILRTLERERKVTRRGKNRWTRWRLVEAKVQPVTEGPSKRQKGSEEVERAGSLEGRIMQACMMGPKTMGQLGGEFGDVPTVSIQTAVGKLVREGELRTQRKSGQVLYAFAG